MKRSSNTPALRLSDIVQHGAFFCRVCQIFTGPDAATAGEVWQRCEKCHQAGVLEWRPGVISKTTMGD